jgi:hypothetical protein
MPGAEESGPNEIRSANYLFEKPNAATESLIIHKVLG